MCRRSTRELAVFFIWPQVPPGSFDKMPLGMRGHLVLWEESCLQLSCASNAARSLLPPILASSVANAFAATRAMMLAVLRVSTHDSGPMWTRMGRTTVGYGLADTLALDMGNSARIRANRCALIGMRMNCLLAPSPMGCSCVITVITGDV